MDDQRATDRVETSQRGRILAGGSPVLDCLIKDLSDSGAKIQVDGALALPPDFHLEMVETGESFHVEIRWRYAHLVGVRFVGADAPAPDEPTRDELMVENIKLREVLEMLAMRLTQLGERVVLPVDLMKRLRKDMPDDGRNAVL